MGLQTIPDDKELAGSEMAPEIFEKGDDFRRADGAFDELEVEFQKVRPATAESWFHVKLYCRTGVFPRGAQVRTR
jgi:hypothetical protein